MPQLDTVQDLDWWHVERLRATTFHPIGTNTQRGSEWWEQVIGDNPDQVLARPKEKHSQLTGILDDNQVTLVVRPERVDWVIQADLGGSNESAQEVETLGPLTHALGTYRKVFEDWLRICPSTVRLAFGAVLMRQVSDYSSAIQFLSRLLPNVELDDAGSEDFLYQINRPRSSQTKSDLRINRLTKWSVVQIGTITLGVETSGGSLTIGPQQLACQLELDINTPASLSEPFNQDEPQSLFSELLELGIELAHKGDLP